MRLVDLEEWKMGRVSGRRLFLRWTAFAIALSIAGAAAAQIRIHRHLTIDDGLVQSEVNAIFEDRDGYLWLGTNDGVSRFDGRDFVNFQAREGIPPGPVNAIHQAPDGTLFFATHHGVRIYQEGRLSLPSLDSGLREAGVSVIAAGTGGRMFFGGEMGIVVREADGGPASARRACLLTKAHR